MSRRWLVAGAVLVVGVAAASVLALGAILVYLEEVG
jgi:hypothetical protein